MIPPGSINTCHYIFPCPLPRLPYFTYSRLLPPTLFPASSTMDALAMVVLDKHVTAKTIEERFAAVKVMHLRHLEDRREFSLCLLKEASCAAELLLNPCLRRRGRLDTMAHCAAAASALGTSSNAAPASTSAFSSVAAMPGTSSTKAATASVPRQQSCGAEVL